MSIDSPIGKYIVPAGDGVGNPILLDIAAVVAAEVRLQEVAQTNSHNAAELLSCFADNWGKLNRTITLLTHERNVAKHHRDIAYAEALLGADAELEKRKTKSSKEMREAVAEVNPQVRAATERLNEIITVLSYIGGKALEFQNAYNSVKKLISERSSWQPNQPLHSPQPSESKDSCDDDFEMPAGFANPHANRY